MRDKAVRECVETFLRSTLRTVVVPASIGIGLTLIGCSGSSSSGHADAAADASARLDTTTTPNRLDTATADKPSTDLFPIDYAVFKLDTPSAIDTPIQNPDTRLDTARDTFVADRRDTQPSDTTDSARPDTIIRLDLAPDVSVIRLDAAPDRAVDTTTDVVHADAVVADGSDDT
jgi:hypothetical protein